MWKGTLANILLESRRAQFRPDLPFLKDKTGFFLISLILAVSILIVIISIKFRVFHLWVDFLSFNVFLRISSHFFLTSAIIIMSSLAFRTVLWLWYRPLSSCETEGIDWPSISVIMPALNEEKSIRQAIDSVFDSDYPQDKVEVISIDDGSTDLTLHNMLEARKKYNSKLKVIHFPRNLGKRKALYVGMRKSKAEIIITVDTDSRIEKSSLKNLVLPLTKDESTGAVAGRVEVWNEKENLITRMLSLHYSISFNFGRAYQSVYGAVFCCPGALAAYRANILWSFIHEWVNQKFLNVQCTYGEDRALTTQILKSGYMTRFQSNAIVYTEVPSGLRQMMRMYLRWTRSNIRESILFAKFMFTNYRSKNRVLPVFDFFFINSLHPFLIFSFGIMTYSFIFHPFLILRHLAFLVIASSFFSLYALRTRRSLAFLYGIPYGFVTAFFLWWIVPYSALTMKNQSWVTR